MDGTLFNPVQFIISAIGDAILWLMQSSFVGVNDYVTDDVKIPYENGLKTYESPNFQISPELIFLNKIAAFDINFFNPNEYLNIGKENYYINTAEKFGKALKDKLITYEDGLYGESYRHAAVRIVMQIMMEENPDDVMEVHFGEYLQHDDFLNAVGSSAEFLKLYREKVLPYYPMASFMIEDDITEIVRKVKGLDPIVGEIEQGAVDFFKCCNYREHLEGVTRKYYTTLGEYIKRIESGEISWYAPAGSGEGALSGYGPMLIAGPTGLWDKLNVDMYKIPKDFDYYKYYNMSAEQIGTWIYNKTSANDFDGDVDYILSEVDVDTHNLKVQTINGKTESSAKILQPVVSYWYNVLRGMAGVAMISVLVYIGIRIVIASASSEKARYKELLKDWVVALCILLFMHYLMSGIVDLTQKISNSFDPPNQYDDSATYVQDPYKVVVNGDEITYSGDKYMGLARLMMQSDDFSEKIVYTIIYTVFVIYTLIFSVIYLKRLIYLAFLTIISPIVAFTYPLDKLRDGSAQGFSMWLKEYIFNIIIQPFHLILYYIIIGMTFNLIEDNPIYAIVALGFLMPAEKILRKFFGFDKASEQNTLGGMLSGALLMQGINKLRGKADVSSRGDKQSKKENKSIRMADSGHNTGSLMSDIASENPGGGSDGPEEEQPIEPIPEFNPYDRYFAEGYKQNEDGVYFNPEKGKYDPDYDPATDVNYYKDPISGFSPYEKYEADGYGKNDQGFYFNPYTKEYDENYDPANDKKYKALTPTDLYEAENYGKNAYGHYFNPNKDEFDERYNPENDIEYWKQIRNAEIAKKYAKKQANGNRNTASNRKINVENNNTARTRRIDSILTEDPEVARQRKAEEDRRMAEKAKQVKAIKRARMFKDFAKFTGRNALKLYGAATVGTIGVAAGLASDKYSNVATFGLGGAVAGKAMASAGINKFRKIPDSVNNAKEYYEDVRDEAEREVYTDKERKDIVNKRLDDKFLIDKDAIRMFKDEFGELHYEQAMEDALEYRKYGVTDNKTIIKAMTLKTKGMGDRASKKRILVAKTANQLSRKDVEHFGQRLRFNNFKEQDIESVEQAIRDFNDWE